MIVGTKFRATTATFLWGGAVFDMNRTGHTLNCHDGSKFFCWGSYERQKLKLRKQIAWVTSLLDWNFLTSKRLKSMEWQSLGLFCCSKHVASHMWRKRRGTNTWKHISVLSGFHIHDLHKTWVIPESIIASLGEKGKHLYTPFVRTRLQMPRWCTHCFCICMQQPFFQFNSFNQSIEYKGKRDILNLLNCPDSQGNCLKVHFGRKKRNFLVSCPNFPTKNVVETHGSAPPRHAGGFLICCKGGLVTPWLFPAGSGQSAIGLSTNNQVRTCSH